MNKRPVPFALGPVHFIGIGGIGMSGIAEIMLRIGYTVQGSDQRASANTERLEELGAKVFIGHDAAHVDGASAIVYSTAVKPENPEMVAGRERRDPEQPGLQEWRRVFEAPAPAPAPRLEQDQRRESGQPGRQQQPDPGRPAQLTPLEQRVHHGHQRPGQQHRAWHVRPPRARVPGLRYVPQPGDQRDH